MNVLQNTESSPSIRWIKSPKSHQAREYSLLGDRISRRVTTVSITPKRIDIIGYLRARLSEDTNPDTMDSSLEADIRENPRWYF